MKRIRKYADLVLLRVLPTALLLITLFTEIGALREALRKLGNYMLRIYVPGLAVILCFVFLGFASIVKAFRKTAKVSIVCKCLAALTVLVYIGCYVVESIATLRASALWGFSLGFLDSPSEIRQALNVGVLLMIVVCCFLKEKFVKTKWTLVILCSALLLSQSLYEPLYTLSRYHDPVWFRMLWISLLLAYSRCSVMVTGLAMKADTDPGGE